MKTVRELKKWISGCEEISRAVDDLEVLFDFAKEEEASEEEVEKQYQTALHLIEDLELKKYAASGSRFHELRIKNQFRGRRN